MIGLVRDLRFGLRRLSRSPGFLTSAVLTIALGITASVSVFGFLDSIFLRPLSVPSGSRLVRIALQGGGEDRSLSHPAYQLLRKPTRSLERIALHYSSAPLYVSVGGKSSEVQGAVVSASYFPMLEIAPAKGRFFTAGEDSVPDRDAVAVIGFGYWKSAFGGSDEVLGKSLNINGRDFSIIGVAPEGFRGVEPGATANSIWIPAMMFRVGYRWCDALRPGCAPGAVLGRLAPGATAAMAEAELAPLSREAARLSSPEDSLGTLKVESAIGNRDRSSYVELARLLSAVGLLLLVISAANLGGLLLARGLSRGREMALRTSLGASRTRLFRQLLTEDLLIGVLGGAVGLFLSMGLVRVLAGFFALDQEGYSHWFALTLDGRTIGFAVVISVVAVALFGVLPALATSRGELAERIKKGGGGVVQPRARTVLLAAQVGLSVAFVATAALFTRSFSRIVSDQEFDGSHIALLRLRPTLVGLGPDSAQSFLRHAIAGLQQVPGVEAVGYARGTGFLWTSTGSVRVSLPGDIPQVADRAARVSYHEVSPGFFATLGVRVLQGREFTDQDQPGHVNVAMVNAALARRLWARESPVGRSIRLEDKDFQVVGVVRDYRVHSVTQRAVEMAYVAFWQSPFAPQSDARIAVRVTGDPAAAYPALQRAIAEADPRIPVTEMLPMREQVGASFQTVRMSGAVLVGAAAVALLLSAIGLYGVVAFLVARRTREIGIRMALGAGPRVLVRQMLGQGLIPALVGGLIGLAGALSASRLLSSWLFGVSPFDPVAFGTAIAAVGMVSVVACWLPARRAAGIHPVAALRSD